MENLKVIFSKLSFESLASILLRAVLAPGNVWLSCVKYSLGKTKFFKITALSTLQYLVDQWKSYSGFPISSNSYMVFIEFLTV